MNYYLLLRNLNKYEMLSVDEWPYDHVSDYPDDDWYASVYFFNEEHKKQYDATLKDFEDHPERYRDENGKTKPPSGVAGLTGPVTNRLVFDFDNGDDLELARRDTIAIVDKLHMHGIPESAFQICYSGCKGFSVIVKTDNTFTPPELKKFCTHLADGLTTFDKKIYNDVRCLRLPFTRHPKTKHFKIPLSIRELNELTVPEIQELATDVDYIASIDRGSLYMEAASLPDSLFQVYKEPGTKVVVEVDEADTLDIDWSTKPKWLSNCKYALTNGLFKEGNRDHFFTILAATFKSQWPSNKGMVYRMLKAVAEAQAKRNGTERFPDKDIWLKVEQVFKSTWNGGQYSCKNDDSLKEVCDSLGDHKCNHTKTETAVAMMNDVSHMFREYAQHIDKNTIKTGIGAIDQNVRITSGMHVGVLGSPGSGKTTALLNILNHTSKAGVKSFFFSMDMYAPLVYQKQLQLMTGYDEKKLFRLMAERPSEIDLLDKQLAEEYGNVRFCFKSGLAVEDIRQIVLDHQAATGEQVKLIAIDYAECISGPYSDQFANSKIIAHKLKDLASQDGFCVLTLVQPPKTAGDASTPLYSMRQVKGPSDWEQGFSIIMGIYREGFNPNNPDTDRFITINSLKNRMGPSFRVDCAWDGARGSISDLSEEDAADLEALRQNKAINEDGPRVMPFKRTVR